MSAGCQKTPKNKEFNQGWTRMNADSIDKNFNRFVILMHVQDGKGGGIRFALQFVLPNTQHAPTYLPQYAVYRSVARFIPDQLPPPECTIVLWLGRVLRATVPQTAVHEHREFEFLENEIGFAKHRLIAPPAGDAMPPQ